MLLPVIMAGGTGSRLWPLSRQLFPKQFLALSQANLSMLQGTCQRLEGLGVEPPLLICNEEHRFLAAEHLRQMGMGAAQILLEPVGRNTAPALALAALEAISKERDPILLVLPADHLIQDVEKFQSSVLCAMPLAEGGELVTFGIVPTHAETGYGYIEKGAPVGQDGFRVRRFKEKPDAEQAAQYLQCDSYLWNSGLFMFKASRYLEELAFFRPDILETCKNALAQAEHDMDFIRINREIFGTCPEESIDYAVMEKTQRAVVVPMEAGWSDIGSWSALWEVREKDSAGNALCGDTIAISTRNTLVHAESRMVATLGIDDLIVVETKDAVLVAHRDHAQSIKSVVEQLKREGRDEHLSHREVYRPWGVYESLDSGARYQVKRITVRPGGKLSLQMHHHRAEHWIVVSGTAQVTNGDKVYLVTENQSTFIPVGQVHSIENPGKIPLELIEVQSGDYLGEDDIVRFSDAYGRA